MRGMTSLPYGWSRIWTMALGSFVTWRYFFSHKDELDDEITELKYIVCSNVIAYCFSKHYVDLTHEKNDNYISPSDLSRSSLLNYLFTLTR